MVCVILAILSKSYSWKLIPNEIFEKEKLTCELINFNFVSFHLVKLIVVNYSHIFTASHKIFGPKLDKEMSKFILLSFKKISICSLNMLIFISTVNGRKSISWFQSCFFLSNKTWIQVFSPFWMFYAVSQKELWFKGLLYIF